LYPFLATGTSSFKQPFVLPLVKLNTYLEHFPISRAHIANVLHAPEDIIARTTLGLSGLAYKLIVAPATFPKSLQKLHGIHEGWQTGTA
jgi:hypothetical protein